MEQNLKEKIIKIYSLLSPEQKSKDIIKIENVPENSQIINYLESIGPEVVKYETIAEPQFGKIQEKGGITYLWYKESDGRWIIKLWQINRLLEK